MIWKNEAQGNPHEQTEHLFDGDRSAVTPIQIGLSELKSRTIKLYIEQVWCPVLDLRVFQSLT